MAHKFLRDDGWFQFPTPVDIGISTTTTTALLSFLSNSLSTSKDCASTGTTGPTVAQGTVGTWFASGNVAVTDTVSSRNFTATLTDGAATIDGSQVLTGAANSVSNMALSGVIANPAGNIRIVVSAGTSGSALILSTSTVLAQTAISTLTVFRIG